LNGERRRFKGDESNGDDFNGVHGGWNGERRRFKGDESNDDDFNGVHAGWNGERRRLGATFQRRRFQRRPRRLELNMATY
jgi:hypothetical protein